MESSVSLGFARDFDIRSSSAALGSTQENISSSGKHVQMFLETLSISLMPGP